jgi:UDP:flavonoid glycosyltransferase YjiC (YdhE family)
LARKRILFLAEGVTMAHFVRPLALAETLDPERYEVHFYAPLRFVRFLNNKPFATGELHSMPGEQFLENISKGAPLFSTNVLRGYVRQERELITRIAPDLTIGDLRLSLPVSARLEGALCAVLINAYWSPYSQRRSIIPSVPLTRIVPPKLLGPLFRLTEPIAHAVHVHGMNKIRKELGLPPVPNDLRAMYTQGDYVLYADVPEFVPARNLPSNHYYVGTCPWTPSIAKPDWWDAMTADPKPKVFVALGSSGPLRALPALFKALSELPVKVLISTSGRAMPSAGPDARTAALLPFTETAAHSAVVVSHGGSSGFYPAIEAGTPVLGIPANADQQISTAALVESGAGLGVRVEEASPRRLLQALERLLNEPQFRASAQRWSAIYRRYDSGTLFRQFLDQVLPK